MRHHCHSARICRTISDLSVFVVLQIATPPFLSERTNESKNGDACPVSHVYVPAVFVTLFQVSRDDRRPRGALVSVLSLQSTRGGRV